MDTTNNIRWTVEAAETYAKQCIEGLKNWIAQPPSEDRDQLIRVWGQNLYEVTYGKYAPEEWRRKGWTPQINFAGNSAQLNTSLGTERTPNRTDATKSVTIG